MDSSQYQMLAWCSPAYPTGAFSYSHGMEWAVECGTVASVATLLDFVAAVLQRGGGWVDAVLFAHAGRAASGPEELWQRSGRAQLRDIAELACAFRATAETALESRQQGGAFLDVTLKAWPHPRLSEFASDQRGAPLAQVGCRRGCLRGPWHRADGSAARLRTGNGGQPGVGRGAADSARPDRCPDRGGAARADGGRGRHPRP